MATTKFNPGQRIYFWDGRVPSSGIVQKIEIDQHEVIRYYVGTGRYCCEEDTLFATEKEMRDEFIRRFKKFEIQDFNIGG